MTVVRPSTMKRVADDVLATERPKAAGYQLHAPDPTGAAAYRAVQLGWTVLFALRDAASASLSPDERRTAVERVFTSWPAMCRAMAELETAAPNGSAAGYERAAMLREIAERAGGG